MTHAGEMKPAETAVGCASHANEAWGQHTGALVARHMRVLFQRLPMLAGFELRTDLIVADVSANPSTGGSANRSLYPRVMQAIVELAETHPEALQVMRGRTFARSRY